ncbi:MAG: type II and III secretion system protein [Verrucomicrobia bacterium]|nr:type II and III secretion system protein [Verrucomicrobiota bacterium]
MNFTLFRSSWLLFLGCGLCATASLSQSASSTLEAPTTERDTKRIEILTSPADATLLAAAWYQATGRRLSWTAQIQSLNVQKGVYTGSEFEALFRAALEASGFEVFPVTDSLDYVRQRRHDYAERSVLQPEGRRVVSNVEGLSDAEKPDKDGAVISISAEIGSVTLGKTHQSGVDFLAALDDFRVSNDGAGTGVTLGTGQNAYQHGFTVGSSAQPLSRYIKLLDQHSDYNSIARPRMECLSGETAMISTGQRVAVPSQTLTASFGGPSTSATISYQNVVLSLEIRPVLLETGRIGLTIKQTDDSISGTQVISGNSVPTIASQKFSTRTVVNQGECIALGGIRINRTTKSATGPRGLSRIPVLGRLFRVEKQDVQNAELLILITARVR